MIELISIHIPKTAGTSFHRVLKENYGDLASPAFKRRDVLPCLDASGKTPATQWQKFQVIHGHFHYQEIIRIHQVTNAKIICWLRHPVDRVISNYRFFKHRLMHPELNPEVHALNLHRIDESLLEYAEREENRNRMNQFLTDLPLEDLFFIGFQERYALDLAILAKKLHWDQVNDSKLNEHVLPIEVDDADRRMIESWNLLDMALYQKALLQRGLSSTESNP